jgi:hypothetical protein
MLQLYITLAIRIVTQEAVGRGGSLKTEPLKTIQPIDIDKTNPLFLTNSGARIWSFCIFPLAGEAR